MHDSEILMESPWEYPPPTVPSWVARAEVVLRAVCWYFDINKTELVGIRRTGSIRKARSLLIYLLIKDFKYTTFSAGYRLCRDHTTICSAVQSVEKNVHKYKDDIDSIRHLVTYMRTPVRKKSLTVPTPLKQVA
jgi:hypothetical protein